MTVVINVLHFCFELRAEDDQKNEAFDSSFFNQWDLAHLSNIEYASLFIKHNVNITTYRLSAQNAPNAEVNVSARL